MTYTLGIDVSTTATKALLLDERGRVAAVASSTYPCDTPRPLWSEQDPGRWWDAAVTSIRAVLEAVSTKTVPAEAVPKAVAAIGLTGQMHGLVLLDADGVVLRPAMLWNDGRAGYECDLVRERVGRERLIALTGNDALAGFSAPKLLWVRRHEPDVYARVRHVLLPKDYLRYRLTGAFATDRAGAAGTLLLDHARRDWSDEVLAALDVPAAWLPPTHEGPDVTGIVTEAAARATGLRAGIPVVAGAGDQAAGAVGVGAVREGTVSLVVGTSGVVFAPAERPVVEPEGRLHAFCHALPDRWHLMGVMLSAAGSLRWYRDTLAPEVSYDTLLAEAESVPAGAEGLLFLPYLTGERTPHPDPLARGAFVGLTVRHTRAYLTRAVLEGVAFGLRDGFALLRETGLPVDAVRVSGGGARSPLWRQILADVLRVPLATTSTTEGAALGAALLAGVGAGLWPDIDAACTAAVALASVTQPGPVAYEAAYATYAALYPALKSSFVPQPGIRSS